MKDKRAHQLFLAGILLKGFFAVLEVICGVSLFFITMGTIQHLIDAMSLSALFENPNDFFAASLMDFMHHFTASSKIFLGFYFLVHGAVKLAVVLGLLSGRLWAFPVGLVAMTLFVVYQLHRYTNTHAAALIVISVFDLLIMALILREYQAAKRQRPV